MIETKELLPGVTLRCCRDTRFKQSCLSFAILRPMCRAEAGLNALIPAVLLRGTKRYPDLRSITWKLDDLYGAAVGTQVRRIGDYQTTGLSCAFLEDRFALPGDRVMEPMLDFLRQLLLEPVLSGEGFRSEYVESEKRNLIATIQSERNDKRAYALSRMLRTMCREDSYGIPRLGEAEDVAAIDPVGAYAHYQKILRESPIHIFYVGSAEADTVAELLMPIFAGIDRNYVGLPEQTPFRGAPGGDITETMDVAQGKLCLGYTTPITNRDPEFPALQVMNVIFGAGMTSKLFVNVREKLSLCYDIGSSLYGAKGIVTVSAGIDFDREDQTRREIARQLQAICDGDVTEEEFLSAREALLSSLQAVHDSPGAIEGFYATAALNGQIRSAAERMEAIRAVTKEQVAEAARSLSLHTTYFLKGASE